MYINIYLDFIYLLIINGFNKKNICYINIVWNFIIFYINKLMFNYC